MLEKLKEEVYQANRNFETETDYSDMGKCKWY